MAGHGYTPCPAILYLVVRCGSRMRLYVRGWRGMWSFDMRCRCRRWAWCLYRRSLHGLLFTNGVLLLLNLRTLLDLHLLLPLRVLLLPLLLGGLVPGGVCLLILLR